MGVTIGFAKYVHLLADAGGQRHHMFFTQWIDRWVGHLSEFLPEIIADQALFGRKHRHRRVIAH
ncbi:Uncharacterised protein [Vibrio cholerae]|nr:Uncharacterised protein [Vibrio cholerae]CSD11186.1 Uncharacterised protein [Vibrio cholerae]